MTRTERFWPAVAPLTAAAVLALCTVDVGAAMTLALAAGAVFAARARMWGVSLCAAAWTAVFVAVYVMPGPYDSWAGRAAVPVLGLFVGGFLVAWVVGRRLAAGRTEERPVLGWPTDRRLLAYLALLLAVGVVAAFLRFRGVTPPLFDANPDAARQVLRERANIFVGLLSEAWTLGMAISLLRALTTRGRRLVLFLAIAAVFTCGAALGASKNSVLVGVVPALVAALSVRRNRPRVLRTIPKAPVAAVLLLGVAAVGTAVFLGGQRTLAGTGTFEDEFRSRYGDNVISSSAGSLDLSLSSSVETFGRLWAQRSTMDPEYGAYSLLFLGSRVEPLVGTVDLYGATSQLSLPYYMNTATFAAIPVLDWGPAGAAAFLVLLGLGVGFAERRLEFSASPAAQLGRAFVVYFAVFGVYELYPFIYPTWLSLIPGLWVLHRLGRTAT